MMAVGFVPEIEIWEVDVNGIPMARFTDEDSAKEYVRQIKEEASENNWLKSSLKNINIYPANVARFVGTEGR